MSCSMKDTTKSTYSQSLHENRQRLVRKNSFEQSGKKTVYFWSHVSKRYEWRGLPTHELKLWGQPQTPTPVGVMNSGGQPRTPTPVGVMGYKSRHKFLAHKFRSI